MSNPRYRLRRQRWRSFRRTCRHLFSRAFKWAILSYGFIAVYGMLYGSIPAIIHRLGTTLAALSAGFAILFFGLVVLSKLTTEVSGWLHNQRWIGYG